MQYGQCPSKKRKLGHRNTQREDICGDTEKRRMWRHREETYVETQREDVCGDKEETYVETQREDMCGDTERRQPSTSHRERPQKKLTLLTP